MAKYNIYGHVLYSEIEYEKLMYTTERIFINALMNRIGSIEQWTNDIWNDIDHEYMITTLEEIKKDIINTDIATLMKYSNTAIDIEQMIEATEELANLYDINSIEKFRIHEKAYGQRVAKYYKRRLEFLDNNSLDELEYLTQQIKDFSKIEQSIPYYSGGEIIRMVTPSTYLSMLYNVNLTRTAWNQTFKDAEYFEKDLMILETHPNSCPLCAPMQGKIYSRTGKSKRYPSIEVAYSHGVGHPNCKCVFSIYWDKLQLGTQDLEKTGDNDYENDQKKKAIEREIRKTENNMNLYRMIGNYSEVDKAAQRIEKLESKL
jgi:hypothetical protein